MQEPYTKELLRDLFFKSKKTVEVLSEYLLLSKKKQLEDIISMLEEERIQGLKEGQNPDSPRTSKGTKILLHDAYKHITHESAIKLMLRIRKLYQALSELKKIIQLIIKQEDIFQRDGLIYTCVKKYQTNMDQEMTVQDESIIMRGFQVLKQLSRRISHFLNDNRVYKSFVFDGQDYQIVLLDHAKNLTLFLQKKNPEQSKKYIGENGDIQEYMMNTIGTYATSEQLSLLSNHLTGSANLADINSLAKAPIGRSTTNDQEHSKEPSNHSTYAHSQPDVIKDKKITNKPGNNQMDSSFKTE